MKHKINGRCRSCLTDIIWVQMEKSGKTMPLNWSSQLKIYIKENGKAVAFNVYESHYATCAFGPRHRKKKVKAEKK